MKKVSKLILPVVLSGLLAGCDNTKNIDSVDPMELRAVKGNSYSRCVRQGCTKKQIELHRKNAVKEYLDYLKKNPSADKEEAFGHVIKMIEKSHPDSIVLP